MKMPPIVSPQEWDAAREQLLVKEKELTRARDALAAERRRMPRMAVEKDYRFEGPDGPASLLDLFEGRRQLIVYRFFFEPGVAGWPESGCRGCSFMADQVAHLAHLNSRDTTFANVSRAPQADIERWKARMGWEIPWYTITDDFDADFGVDEWHGTNAFYRDDEDRIFRTYFIDKRGDEALGSAWAYLDITALGRQEKWEDSPEGYPQTEPYGGGTSTTSTTSDRLRGGPSAAPLAARLEGRAVIADDKTLRIERTFQAPAEAVFDAWTSEEVMRRWFQAGRGWETPDAQVDLRVGGAVRVVMRDPDEDSRARRRRPLHRDRPPDPPGLHLDLGRRRGQADADRDRLRGGRRRHHRALHPQRPPGRGVGPLPRRRLDDVLRQPRGRPGSLIPRTIGATAPWSSPTSPGCRSRRPRSASGRRSPPAAGSRC